jgi:hypothetical protein
MALEELELLDPSAEREPTARPLAARLPADPAGQRIALLDIRKPRGDVFLDELELLLVDRGYEVERTAKLTFTKPAASDLRRDIAARCGAVIEALAD